MFLEIVEQEADDFALRLELQLVAKVTDEQGAVGDQVARDEHRVKQKQRRDDDKYLMPGEQQRAHRRQDGQSRYRRIRLGAPSIDRGAAESSRPSDSQESIDVSGRRPETA